MSKRSPGFAPMLAALSACCLGLLSAAAHADSHQKPGLWEVGTATQMKNDKTAAAGKMPQLSPQVQAMLAQRGISMPQMNADGSMTHAMTQQVCVTPEMAAKADHPDFGNDRKCQMTKTAYSGNTFSGEIQCDSPDMKGSGTVEFTFEGNQAYHGTMHFTGTSARGGPMELSNQITAKWLAADCGSVK